MGREGWGQFQQKQQGYQIENWGYGDYGHDLQPFSGLRKPINTLCPLGSIIIMRIVVKLLFCVLFCSFIASVQSQQSSSSTNDPVVINFVSTIAGSTTSTLTGSFFGGTALYIQGFGFDATFENNIILVGTTRCETSAKGVTQNNIVCYTGAYTSGATNNLPITIQVLNKQPYTCSTSACLFSYSTSQTPYLNAVYPRVSSGNQWLNFYGIHRIASVGDGRDMGDVVGLYIGDSLCSLFDIIQGPISSGSNAMITCALTPTQEGGYYNIKEWVTPGIASNSPKMNYASVLYPNKVFQFIVSPAVTSINLHSAGSKGSDIIITGTGFSADDATISVTAAGLPCTVKSSTSTQIICRVGEDYVGNTYGRYTSNATVQLGGYVSGSGLTYERYETSKLSEKMIDLFKLYYDRMLAGEVNEMIFKTDSDNEITPLVMGETAGASIYPEYYYVSKLSGYFLPPRTGTYVFRALADDSFQFSLANVTGSKVNTTNNEYRRAYSGSYLGFSESSTNFFYKDNAQLKTGAIPMIAGEAYYTEVYHFSNAGYGSYKLAVEIPGDDVNAPNQVYEVQRLSFNQTVIPEIIEFSIDGGFNSGEIVWKMIILNPTTLVATYNVTASFTAANLLSNSAFRSHLMKFAPYANFNPTVSAVVSKDIDGNVVANNAPTAYKRTYTVTMNLYRSETYTSATTQYKFTYDYSKAKNTVNTSTVPSVTETHIQDHSPPIAGTYGIQIGTQNLSFMSNGVETFDIPFDTSASTLIGYFASSVFQYKQVEIDTIGPGFVNGNTFVIQFVGVKGDLPPMVIDVSKLTGGNIASPPTATVLTHRDGSTNILMDPINAEVLGTYSTTPSVLVKVNGATSRCLGDCSYTVTQSLTPTLVSASLTDNVLKLNITTDVAIGAFDVVFGGQTCTYDAVQSNGLEEYACTLPYTGAISSPLIEAGQHVPTVHIPSRGYADNSAPENIVDYGLSIDSVSPGQGLKLGGTTITLTGKGFPFNSDAEFSLKLADVEATYTTVSNTQIKLISPPSTVKTDQIVLTFNSKTANGAFDYTDTTETGPTITSISPDNYSPVLKGFMTIEGTGFGTNANDLSVWLHNETAGYVYQLNVIEVADTELKVRIPGGESHGTYRVLVTREGLGDAIPNPVDANVFSYRISINSISPTTGSINGGTILTITGENFSPILLQNQAYVGDALNWNCDIITVTPTQITCRTPPFNPNYTTLSQPVIVVGRAMIDSACAGTCEFLYDNATYPTVGIANPAAQYKSGDVVTLFGTHFLNNGITPIVSVGGVVATINSFTDTEVVFVFPALETGTYNLNLEVNGVGYASPTLAVFTPLTVGKPAPEAGSYAANTIKITGNGLGDISSKFVSFNAISSAAVPFSYKIRTDNTPTSFGIDFVGCSNGATITLNYYYKNVLYQNKYNCSTSLTQSVTIPGTKTFAYSAPSKVVTFNRTSLISYLPQTFFAYPVDTNGVQIGNLIPLTVTNLASGTFSADLAALTTGKYAFRSTYSEAALGSGDFKNQVEITQDAEPTLAPTIQSGFAGGAPITVSGTGLSSFSKLTVAGVPATLLSSTATTLVYTAPALVTASSQAQFGIAQEGVLSGTLFGDSTTNITNVADKLISTKYSSSAATCFIGYDFGASQQALITRVRYFPNPTWKSAILYIGGATIKASVDGVTYDTLATIDSTTHTGWNIWKPTTPLTQTYRYVRFEHNSTSKCELAEFEVSGYLYAGTVASLASETRDIILSDGVHTKTFTGGITYKSSITPLVQGVTPKYGSPAGGDDITLTGVGFGTVTGDVSVVIDGVACVVSTVSDVSIVCKTAARTTLPASNSFVVSVKGNVASVDTDSFLYAHRWSDELTWGGDFAPIDGDTVYVPQGMVLLVDQSTPNLYLILVEGSIIFEDKIEMTVETTFLIVENGVFRAGTEEFPYQNKLTFILHGDYYDTQLPGFGNKVIGCHSCTFDLHGKVRDHTWTELESTAPAGTSSIFLTTAVDWLPGEEIVIASTGFDHREAEQRTILTVSVDKKQITLNKPLVYTHISVEEEFSVTDSIPMKAEVGLLTRNIKITGDSYSERKRYGAHVMMHGPAEDGLVARISYTEFTHCGQPAIVGRYCIHFHMNGDVSDSYVKGNSVHESFARVLTIHAVYFLTVQYNVGYRVSGHNIFLEDGIEQYNLIEYNCMFASLQVFNMLQTDISVASYWITNPLNTVRFNRAAGSDFYGLWYEIKKNPDGASATTDICPTGLPLGECHDNVAHSNMRFGLRIFQLWSAKNPCKALRNSGEPDPWASNPSIQNRFYNFVLWRNAEDGLLAEQIGNTIFENFKIADNARAGFEFYKTNFSKQNVIAKDFVVVGRSENNGMPLGNFSGTSGLITSRTDGSEYTNIRFYNFPEGSTVISVGSKNEQMTLRAVGCKNYNFSQISITNASGNYLNYIYTRRYILHDMDGTLAGSIFDGTTRTASTITPYYPHNVITGKCKNATDQVKWSDSLICNSDVVVNDVQFAAAQPAAMFFGVRIFVKRLDTDLQDYAGADPNTITGSWVQKTDPEQMNTWSLPFVSGYTYSVFWSTGLDWTSLTVNPSFYFRSTDDAFILRFNYTTSRELFDIGKILAGRMQTPLLTAQGNMLTYSACQFGDYYLDAGNQFLFVCVSGKGKAINDLLNLNGVTCRYLCPKPGGFTKEKFVRSWSNVTQWPNGVLPQAGDNVTINGNWTILMDVDVENLDNITIDGDVFLTESNRKFSANFIWIRYGSLSAGNSSNPFQFNFTITLNGPKQARTYTVDPIISVNKYLVVTGTLNLYGIIPSVVSTRLTAIAAQGATTLTVASASGWVVGNTIGIAPSFGKSTEFESVTITAISGNTITFTPALSYTHYGQSYTFNNSYGSVEMRASVGLFDRNIKIVRGSNDGWGYGVLIYAWNDGENIIAGSGQIRGVQFVGGGQYDTLNAALNIINTAAANIKSNVYASSFQNCGGYCFYFSNVNNATIDNNYVYVGKKFIAYAENVKNYKFSNNVLVGASARESMVGSLTGDDIACYQQYTALDWTTANVLVENNHCQGSALTGFEFPHTPCEYLGVSGIGFVNNVAGSAKIGFLFSGGMDCAGGEKLRVYSSGIGVVTNPKAKSFVWNNLIIVDTARGVGLRFGGYDQNNNSMVWKNSYISAISRPTCSVCYGSDATPCSNMKAVRLLAATENTEVLPKIFGDSFQTICKAQLFDSQVWIYNVTFENYNTNYPGVLETKCGKNMLFESHPIDDSSIGNHHFFNTTCKNCDANALGHYDPPIEKHFGWLGGCGNFPCSGRSNYIMYDHDGSLLGFKGIIIPNNSVIGNNTPGCTWNSVINGHVCSRSDFARLKYTSIASDFDTRMTWPVNLTYDGGNWTTSTNGWREWQWDGDEPLNKRKGRFLSIVQLSKIYNMSFESQPPTDMLFSFSLPTWSGDNSQWIGVKIYYPIPNAISVTLSNGSATKSLIASDTDEITNHVDKCGANKYFYKNNTIHFIVTGDAQCKVRVTLTSSVQVTARLSVNISDFYGSNGITTFLDQMSAFLNIPTNRLKIVGVYAGSTIVDSVILPPPVSTDDAGTAVPNDAATVADLRDLAARAANVRPSDLPGVPGLIGASATVNVMTANGDVVPEVATGTSDNTKFIIIGVVVGVVGAALVGLSIFLIVSKLRSRNPILPDESVNNLGEQASKDVLRQENRSEFELRQNDVEPEQVGRKVHPS